MGELCRKTPLFDGLDASALEQVAAAMTERVLAPGEVLFRQGDPGDRMFIIARGAAAVTRTEARRGGEPALIDVLGGGDILGEMALLTGAPRNATVRAVTTVTGGEIERETFDRLMQTQPRLRDRIWRSFAERRFDNRLSTLRGYEHLSHADRLAWFRRGEIVALETGEPLPSEGSGFAFVVAGSLERGLRRYGESALVSLHPNAPLRATEQSRVAVVPPLLESDVA